MHTAQFSKYQEQGQLIDPHLDDIVPRLLHMARQTMFHHHTSNGNTEHSSLSLLRHSVFKVLYTLANVRGYKSLSKS